MSRLPEPPNSRSPTWNVTVILSSLCSSSWKHSRECAFKTMLWDRTVGRRAAVATRAEATERRIMGRGTLCPRFEEVLGWLSEQIIRLSECCSKPKMFVAPELLAARECTDHLNSFSTISIVILHVDVPSFTCPRAKVFVPKHPLSDSAAASTLFGLPFIDVPARFS